jgi:flagellar motor switch protein FliM
MPDQSFFQKIDLVHKQRHYTNTLPDLRLFRERFFRACRTRLFQTLRLNIRIDDERSDTLPHDDYLSMVHDGPCFYTIYAMPPLRGLALLSISRSLLAAIVDDLFGAGDIRAAAGQNDLDLSGMERRIGTKFGLLAAQSLRDAFSPQIELTATVTGTESYTALVSIADPTEPLCIMAARFFLSTGSGLVSMAIPYRSLEPHRAALSSVISIAGNPESGRAWEDQMEASLDEVPIELAVQAGVATVSVQQLAKIQIGDVISMKLFRYARIVPADGSLLCLADYGEQNGEIHLRMHSNGIP